MISRSWFRTTPPMPVNLGLGGLVPFLALSALAAWGPESWRAPAATILVGYGALILSFIGGTVWGQGLHGLARPVAKWIHGMVPFTSAWVALLLPLDHGLWLLIAGFIATWILDLEARKALATPAWFMHLRGILTSVVVVSLLVARLTLS